MLAEIKRRLFIKKAIGFSASAALGVWGAGKSGVVSEARLDRTFSDLLNSYRQDKVDERVDYLHYWDTEFAFYPKAQKFFKDQVFTRFIPSGKKLILGSYKHFTLDMMCEEYGAEECLGVDIYNYKNHPQAVVKDVRRLENNEFGSLAIGWNDVSVWSGSPKSKLAGLNFIKKNLVRGGLLIENPTKYMPKDLDMGGFDLVYQDEFGSIWRKV